ncbi:MULTISPECIES: hypothetical protein [Stenotrophomonas]|uniref:hypothetical protein n=1 Tax=Stenotrophomonas pavanii TaxID=487698 RepID=UPI001F332F8D|nr:hypothetical protein [Stenotrophomonas maltophilia]
MNTNDKTLADVQPGGRVRLGDGLPPLPKMQRFTNLYGETYAYTAEQMRDYARAALSAQPSPGGQDAPERCAECRHTTFEVHPDGHICVHCKLIVAARQPVGEPVAYTSEAQLNAVRVSGDGIMSQRNAKWRIPLYTAPPAQAVDLGQFRTKVAELLRSEFDLEVADPEDHRHDDGSGEADRIAGKIVALLDSQAVGNG